MKINKILYISFLATFLFAAISCDDAKLSSLKNGVYIHEAAPIDKYNQQVENLVIDKSTIQNLTIRLANYIDQDVTVSLEIDRDFLEKYNKENGTSYEVLPDEYLSFEKTTTISAGSISAPLVGLSIEPFQTPNGETYAIPVKLSSVDGPVEIMGNASRIMYLLSSPHRQSSPVLRGTNATRMNFATPIKTPTWTVEYWMRMNTTPYGAHDAYVFADNASPISFNSGTSSQLFIRFWKIGALLQGPCYQCQMDGTYFDDNTEAWKADTWYHIAYVYDGNKVQMYIDGEANASKDVEKDFEFSNVDLCSTFNYYFPITQLAQIRIWNQDLKQSSIKDAMSREVSASSEGLIGYWKCDEAEGNTLKDSSPNGNHININGSLEWSEEYNFSKPNE